MKTIKVVRSWRLYSFTRLSCVLSGGAAGGGLLQTVDGDRLVYNEESADDFPFAGPEQSYTERDKRHNVTPQN